MFPLNETASDRAIARGTLLRDAPVVALAALGSNLPWRGLAPHRVISTAAKRLGELGDVQAQSGLWRSPAWPNPAHPEYVNMVVLLSVRLPADELLREMHAIEDAFGRERTERWSDRTLDVDLIDYNGQVAPGSDTALTLPHPRAHERAFVLKPLRDVAPFWRHPGSGLSVDTLLEQLPSEERRNVRRAVDATG